MRYQCTHLSVSSFISVKQHGVTSFPSTLSNLTLFLQCLCDRLNKKQQIDEVVADFTEFLDEIIHDQLLSKLIITKNNN